MRRMIIACCIAMIPMNGCAHNGDQDKSIDIEQIMKEVQEGKRTRKEAMGVIFDARREEIEREYKVDRISRDEYARRKVLSLMEESYEILVTSETKEHLDAVLEMSDKYDMQITKILLCKTNGMVSYSNDQGDVGKSIENIVDDIAVSDEGIHGIEGGKKGDFSMLRPLPNLKGCYGCHSREMRVLGVVYISIGQEELKAIH